MKLSSIRNGEHFMYKNEEYEKLFGGKVSSATNVKTGERITIFGKTSVERPKKTK